MFLQSALNLTYRSDGREENVCRDGKWGRNLREAIFNCARVRPLWKVFAVSFHKLFLVEKSTLFGSPAAKESEVRRCRLVPRMIKTQISIWSDVWVQRMDEWKDLLLIWAQAQGHDGSLTLCAPINIRVVQRNSRGWPAACVECTHSALAALRREKKWRISLSLSLSAPFHRVILCNLQRTPYENQPHPQYNMLCAVSLKLER